jgi:hypothetical protein
MKALCAVLLGALSWPASGGSHETLHPPGQSDPPKSPPGLAVERTVHATCIDWLGRKREVQRKESVLIRGSNVAITDLTYGEKLIIRTDEKKVWMADPLGGHYSEYTFDEVASIRKASFDELRAVKTHVAGTKDEKELDGLLEAYDQFPAAPKVEMAAREQKREVVLNGELVRVTVDIDPKVPVGGYFDAFASIGAFHPAVAETLRSLGGFPMKGKIRYVLFMDRVVEEFEVTSVKAQEVADSDFDLPKGLTKVPLKGFGRPPERKPPKPAEFRRDFGEDGEKPPEKKNK